MSVNGNFGSKPSSRGKPALRGYSACHRSPMAIVKQGFVIKGDDDSVSSRRGIGALDSKADIHSVAGNRSSETAIMLLAVLAAFAIPVLYLTILPPHQDLAGNALSGKLALSLGGSYNNYSMYFPPAERFWFTSAAHISEWTGARLDMVVVSMTACMVVVGSWLGYQIRRAVHGPSAKFFVLSLAVFTLLPILFKNVYGLREHMIMLGFWPYLLLRFFDPASEKVSLPLRIATGTWLGTCLLFKYLYAVAVLLIEIVDAGLNRNPRSLFRFENLLAGAIVALYLLLWLGVDPGQREAIGAMQSAIQGNLKTGTENALAAAPYILFTVLAALIVKLPARRTCIGVALVVGAVLVSAIQQRWYTHHLFPITASYLFLWWMAKERMSRLAHSFIALVLLSLIAWQTMRSIPYVREVGETRDAFSRAGLSLDGQRVGMLAMHPSPYNQFLLASDAQRWNPMMNNAYVGAEYAPIDNPSNRGVAAPPLEMSDPGRLKLHDQMLRLWEDNPPDAIIIDEGRSWPLRNIQVNWLELLSEDERFQKIFSGYRPALRHRGQTVRFTYYARTD